MISNNFNNSNSTSCCINRNKFKKISESDTLNEIMKDKKNYIDVLLKKCVKDDKNLNLSNSFTNLNNKNNINMLSNNFTLEKYNNHNQSTNDDLEKLLQLENDNSFTINEFEAI